MILFLLLISSWTCQIQISRKDDQIAFEITDRSFSFQGNKVDPHQLFLTTPDKKFYSSSDFQTVSFSVTTGNILSLFFD